MYQSLFSNDELVNNFHPWLSASLKKKKEKEEEGERTKKKKKKKEDRRNITRAKRSKWLQKQKQMFLKTLIIIFLERKFNVYA